MGVTLEYPGINNVPIGSVIAWLKSFAGTPALPYGWQECDGSAITYGVYAGSSTPNLSSATANRWLRGASTTGTTGGATSHSHTYAHTHTYDHNHTYAHTHDYSGETDANGSCVTYQDGESVSVADCEHKHRYSGTTGTSTGNTSTSSGNTAGQSTTTTSSSSFLPPYYNVVWIMRIA